MFFLEYLDPLVFFIALGIGVFLAYIMNPAPKVVHKYPTVENAGKITYLDDEGVCYKYHSEEVDVPKDKSNVETIKTQ
jgi:hypothetical protein